MPRITNEDIIKTLWEDWKVQTWEDAEKFLDFTEKVLTKQM